MPQFLISPSAIKNGVVAVTGKDAKHIANVLRLKKGDWLMLTDGRGNRFKGEIVSASSKEISVKILNAVASGQSSSVILAQALIKRERFELILQKAVELGCSKIIPFTSERTSILPNKQNRWQKIADEAAKQCGTAFRPVVTAPAPFPKLLSIEAPKQVFLFYEGENSQTLDAINLSAQAPKHLGTMLIIGPEGGFTSNEIAAAKKAGVVTLGLGPLILRAETAAIAALTLVQHKLGYFNQTPL